MVVVFLYGPSVNACKSEFSIGLNDLGNLIDEPWHVGDDSNEILFSSNRKGKSRTNCLTKSFHNWVSEFSYDLPILNISHTW